MLAAVTTTANFKVTFHWHRAKLHQRGGELWTANFSSAFIQHSIFTLNLEPDHQWTCYSSFSTALGFKFKIQQPHSGSVLFDYLFIYLFILYGHFPKA